MKKGTLHLKNSPNSSRPRFHVGNLAPPPQQRRPGPLPYILAASVAFTVAASMAFSVAAKAALAVAAEATFAVHTAAAFALASAFATFAVPATR